jgi:hypothetical protein
MRLIWTIILDRQASSPPKPLIICNQASALQASQSLKSNPSSWWKIFRTLRARKSQSYFAAGDTTRVYTDFDFQEIFDLLRDGGRDPWSMVPRIYAVLRIIGQLQIIDSFIDQGITDIWFPFSTSSLPKILGSTLHPQFLEVQKGVLTKGLDLERDDDRRHAHFGREEILPFKVDKELGGGRFSQVHKITSTITRREFARKQFRRGVGLRNAAEIKSFKVEIQVLKKIHHHHCVELVSFSFFHQFAADMSTDRKL